MALDYIWEGQKAKPTVPYSPATGLDNANNLFYVSSRATRTTPGQWIQVNTTLDINGVPNSSQSLLNLVAGDNVTLEDTGNGSIVIGSFGANPFISVKDYGATGNGFTDDTAAIQAALNVGGTIWFPTGTYLINPNGSGGDSDTGGLTPISNSVLLFEGGASLIAVSSNLTGYNILRLSNVSNVKIQGATIVGDRTSHVGVTGEFGYGISVWGCQDVWLEDCSVSNCWGDGFYINRFDYPSTSFRSTRIHVLHCVSSNNRRQGMSIIDGTEIECVDSYFINTNGTNPQYGVDIEPGGFGNAVASVKFIGCVFTGNVGRGLGVSSYVSGDEVGISVVGCEAYLNNDAGIAVSGPVQNMLISSNYLHDNACSGVYALYVLDGGLTVVGNKIIGNGNGGTPFDGLDGITLQACVGSVVVGNTVRMGSNSTAQRYGIVLLSCSTCSIMTNDLQNSGSVADLDNYSPTNNALLANILTGGTNFTLSPDTLTLNSGALQGQYFFNGSTFELFSSGGPLVLASTSDVYVNPDGQALNGWRFAGSTGAFVPLTDNVSIIGLIGDAPASVTSYAFQAGNPAQATSGGSTSSGTLEFSNQFWDPAVYSGVVNTSGTGNTVTWVSGSVFIASMVGSIIFINASPYTVATFVTNHEITLTTSPGSQSSVAYTFAGSSADTWTMQTVGGIGSDGSSTLQITHYGSPGLAGVEFSCPVGFNGTAPIAQPTVTGSKGSNAALASLITALASLGLVIDSTS